MEGPRLRSTVAWYGVGNGGLGVEGAHQFADLKPPCSWSLDMCCRERHLWRIQGSTPVLTEHLGNTPALPGVLLLSVPPVTCEAGLTFPVLQMKELRLRKFSPYSTALPLSSVPHAWPQIQSFYLWFLPRTQEGSGGEWG